MNEITPPCFLTFLRDGIARGGFGTDDALCALLPLMKQVQRAHEDGLVAPLDGIADLILSDPGFLTFDPEKAVPPERSSSRLEELQSPESRAMEVVAESSRTSDINRATVTDSDLGIATSGENITKPVFLPGYQSWEHAIGHHNELTDVFSLGLLLASFSCALDFTDADDLEVFVASRGNLFEINPRLNPVVASVIMQMTELNRHNRAPDLAQLIGRLENYREQATELEFDPHSRLQRIERGREASVDSIAPPRPAL